MSIRQLCAGLALSAMVLPVIATPAFAEERPGHNMRRVIAVQGLGTVRARPDTAIIRAGVTTQSKTAKAALEAHGQVMAKLLATLENFGLAERDIQTRQINLHPVYPRRKGDTTPPAPEAFRASGKVRIRLGEIDRVGELLDQLTTVGVNNLSGLQFTIAEPEPLQDEARKLAMQDARRRAQLYAAEAGVELGPVIRIREGGATAGPIRETRQMASMSMAAASPIAAGENEIRISVSVVYAIK